MKKVFEGCIILKVFIIYFFFVNLALSESQIIFTTKIGGNWEICLIEDISNLNPINLTQNTANESMPSWSPNRKKIAFISDRDRDEDEIYILDIETRKVERITDNLVGVLSPEWCPSSKEEKIAYVSGGNVYIVDLLEKETLKITNNMHVHDLTWTSDGNKLAFDSYLVRNRPAVYLVNPYGKIPASAPDDCEVIIEKPPAGTIKFGGLSFSPDQNKFCFAASHKATGDYDIYTMDLSTREFKNLTPNSSKHDRYPCWSPDGKFIAFSSDREGSIGGGDIYFVTPEGMIIRQLKLHGYELDPDIFDPDYVYTVSPFSNSKACTWGEIKRKGEK